MADLRDTIELTESEIMEGMKLTVKVKRQPVISFRFWLTVKLVHFAAWVSPFSFEILMDE